MARRNRGSKNFKAVNAQVGAVGSATNGRQSNGQPNVAFIRPELREKMELYRRINDCIEGSDAVKARGTTYLPMPNPGDDSPENVERYEAYIMRAVFYAVTYRTVHALVGQIFLRDPQVTLPTGLDALTLDCNGEGVTLNQVAEITSRFLIALGRAGLHVDYATAPQGATARDIASGDYRPVINSYSGAHVRNWRKARRGARMVYTLIVIEEGYTVADDGFEAKTGTQFKVLRLVTPGTAQDYLSRQPNYDATYGEAVNNAVSLSSDIYMMEVWRSDTNAQSYNTSLATFAVDEVYYPKDHNGAFLNEIPFKFVGSEQNDDSVDQPPVGALAEVNLSHYRNSADYEESVFLLGQPTPFVSGVTEEWNNNVLKGTIQLGSRGVIALPNGGTAGLLQPDPNTLADGAMQKKERQMVALGAKLVEQREVQRTATEAEMESTADTSILAKIANNASLAIEWALKTACQFTGDSDSEVTFLLNKEFDLTKMAADGRQQLLLEFEADMITESEMRANLRRGGIATLDDATFATQITKQKADRLAEATALAAASIIQTKAVIPGTGATPPAPGTTGNTPGNTKTPGTKPGNKPAPKPTGS